MTEWKEFHQRKWYIQRTEMQLKWLHHVNDSPFIHTLYSVSVEMSSTSSHNKQGLVCLLILGNDSVAKVQSLCLTSHLCLLFFVSDSKRPCQLGDPLLPWTPSRSPKYCSRSLHLQCCPMPETDTNKNAHAHRNTHTLFLSHTVKTSKWVEW